MILGAVLVFAAVAAGGYSALTPAGPKMGASGGTYTLRWTAPLWQEATTPLGHRCLLSLVPERVALCLVVRQPVNGIARCVAKLPCVRGQSMAWTVPDSLRGAYFDVTAADSAGNKSCAGNVVWVP